MFLEAVYHRPQQNWCYAYNGTTIHLRIRTKKNDVSTVSAMTGDKYAWDHTMEYLPMTLLTSDELFDYWECEVTPPYRRLKYGFVLQKNEEKCWMTEYTFLNNAPPNPDRLFEYPYINPIDVFKTPDWVKDAIFYQIFPERFANGDPSINPEGTLPWGGTPQRDNFFGGDLQGVIDHIDYLSNLGINALYFTPLFTATTNHKYDTEDYLQVDPQFGDVDLLKKLVALCHERGIRILMDAVFNHSGRTFAPFVDVQENGESSRYKDWFHISKFPIHVENGIPSYDTFAFEPLMPKLNTENPEVKAYLLHVAEYWIKEVGIDGWRLDVANEVDHQFWREFRQVVKKANPNAYILGEIWHESSSWLQGDQFDAVMNYPFTHATLDFFVEGSTDAEGFSHAIGKQLSRYPRQANEVAFNLLDSHDTARLITLCNEDIRKMKLAVVFLFTFPGTPCIYYGDEIGLTGGHDPDCRKCMEWEPDKQNQDLFTFYQDLIQIRLRYSALRTGTFRFLSAEADCTLLGYSREDDTDHIIILMNNSDAEQSIEVPVTVTTWENIYSGEVLTSQNGSLQAELPPYGYLILRSEGKTF
ncbi:alpha-glycosidase [Paenibacillus sp. IHBB 10380]|uniref:alpha-glycosidase n=1 Tax=Paenibacillus sp. IHBB 10380 TaxID=1566358 RepID=UPI0005CFC435|nr:alpha-glycosidase [Paenibacillus sp. IHBB 10380]AJS61010.1 cyclomaltodextrinase [Paenibacillus sp. IHBB 10380]